MILLLLLFVLTVPALSGCGHEDYDAPQLEPQLPAAEQKMAVDRVQEFIGDINGKNYSAASKLVAQGLGPSWSPAGMAKQMRSGPYSMLSGSSSWTFDPVESLRRGQEMIVHAHFVGGDKKQYNTNFSLADSRGTWPIDFILTPVQKYKAVRGQIHIISKSGPAGATPHGAK